MIPQFTQWTIQSVLFKTRRKNTLVHKEYYSDKTDKKPCKIYHEFKTSPIIINLYYTSYSSGDLEF